jgi:hypothetical protein
MGDWSESTERTPNSSSYEILTVGKGEEFHIYMTNLMEKDNYMRKYLNWGYIPPLYSTVEGY